ncbi:site-2 protease family protein [Dactylosporangium aurantiacum]|uniref:Zinc metalloprotease n=1 Tax=Dactylosporangium aurantiacum TaxID=35754 RepID=A0A9Q9IU89_9ACTN|nr:site-2 protease family protein [Dactylosporangium aurantiacum]MDG6106302.1 site-2 protease family protein [Dactylosporangium aurantiacum]UWZ59644.1 site-2 protease family protein [Dactylosporangium aurantiacum]
MKQTLKFGRIAGIPVGVHWSALVIMVLLAQSLVVGVLPASVPDLPWTVAWLLGVGGAALFLLSLFAHEAAHALVARGFGIRVERLTLWLLGGVAEFRDEPPSARADFLVAIAGPLTSFAAGVGFGTVALLVSGLDGPPAVVATAGWLAMINLVVAVFNLLPGAPLDGGRVLRAALWWWRGDRTRAALTATRTGRWLGIALLFAGLAELLVFGALSGIWLGLLGWFVLAAAIAEGVTARTRAILDDTPVRAVMRTGAVCGEPGQSVESFVPVAAGSRQRWFPLCDDAGHPTGMVGLTALVDVPATARAATTLQQVAGPATRVDAGQAVATVVLPGPTRSAVVVDDGRLVGVLSSDDIARAVEVARLHAPAGDRAR